jgi:hypothetical protein
MEMFTPEDLTGVDENVARRIIVAARSIAPCIDSFADGSEEKKNAIAILLGVAGDLPTSGSRRVKSQRIGSAAVEYWNANTWLEEDRDALRSLCPSATSLGLPRGSFPKVSVISNTWPEGEYS